MTYTPARATAAVAMGRALSHLTDVLRRADLESADSQAEMTQAAHDLRAPALAMQRLHHTDSPVDVKANEAGRQGARAGLLLARALEHLGTPKASALWDRARRALVECERLANEAADLVEV